MRRASNNHEHAWYARINGFVLGPYTTEREAIAHSQLFLTPTTKHFSTYYGNYFNFVKHKRV